MSGALSRGLNHLHGLVGLQEKGVEGVPERAGYGCRGNIWAGKEEAEIMEQHSSTVLWP